ncbi:FMRFamide related propeptide [Lycorma delicatula]|uniref:FMRFamide related propeptide n=1 Tax=Lycorma delicatula TaxID=130591 RepID=UPI003F50F2C8
MTSLRLVLLSATLLPSLWAEPGPGSSIQLDKRFSINMMDPLTRRSALDKNFVRFGRSNGGINVNRKGRPDSFVRFGRASDDENHEIFEDIDDINEDIRRDTRGRTDFIRFGRAGDNRRSNSGFIRFGRARNDNFVRFGRARPDSFIRFGRGVNDYLENFNDENDFQRLSRGNPKSNTNFVRFGKRVPENDEEIVNAYKNGLTDKENLARSSRLSNKHRGDSFIRFGRIPKLYDEEFSKKLPSYFDDKIDKIPQRSDDEQQLYNQIKTNPEMETEIESTKASRNSDTYTSYDTSTHDVSRKKRSISTSTSPTKEILNQKTESLPVEETPDITSSTFYNYPSPLAAGLPNFIIGPELSVLPTHAKSHNNGKKVENKNFIRLG